MTKYFFLTLTVILLTAASVFAQSRPLRVENVARVKGQETTTIRGVGIVSGLPATGDDPKAYTPAAQAMLRQLARSGMFTSDAKGINGSRNNALVDVFVTIPATGAKNGEIFDCTVVSIGNAKSLAGGVLSATILGTSFQQDENSLVMGQAQGRITIEDPATPTVGKVVNGARLHADFTNPYIQDGLITLILKKEYSRPQMALKVAEEINNDAELQLLSSEPPAKSINSTTVVVRVPSTAYGEPNDYLARVLDVVIPNPPIDFTSTKVTINERLGTIVIGENVEVRPSLVNHKNIIAEVAPETDATGAPVLDEVPQQFVDIDTDIRFRQMNGEAVMNMKLKALQASLQAIRATTQDMIDIIKTLHEQGAIVGEVVFVD